MPMDQWPCIPGRLDELLPQDTIEFLVAGASEMLGRPILLAERIENLIRYWDPPDRYRNYQLFCRHLRMDGAEEATRRARGVSLDQCLVGGDRACRAFDEDTARRLFARLRPNADAPFVYSCYMGLSEMALMLDVGGYRFLAISGQFLPVGGVSEIYARLDSRTTSARLFSDVEPLAARLPGAELASFEHYAPDTNTWAAVDAALRGYAESLVPLTANWESAFFIQARKLEEIGRRHHSRAKMTLEDGLRRQARLVVPDIGQDGERDLKVAAGLALAKIRKAFGARYAALFAPTGIGAEGLGTNLLPLYSSVGLAPDVTRVPHHLNWRKAGFGDSQALGGSAFGPVFGEAARIVVQEGIKGPSDSAFSDAWCCVPKSHSPSLKAVMVLGPVGPGLPTADVSPLLADLLDGIALPLFMVQGRIGSDRTKLEWEQTSRVTGHRVRAGLQGIENVVKTLQDFDAGKAWVSRETRDAALLRLKQIVETVRMVSAKAELAGVTALDPAVSKRDVAPLGEIVWEAIDDYDAAARANGITVDTARGVSSLPEVNVDRVLTRIALGNLMDNAIKYSRDPEDGRPRTIEVKSVSRLAKWAAVEFVNFGQGIPREHIESVFTLGVRFVDGEIVKQQRARAGSGIGLWEARRVIENQGGHLRIRSSAYDGGPVNSSNIDRCVTVVTVELPIHSA